MTTASDALVTSVVHIFLLHSESAASSLREHYGICAFVADPAWSEVVEAASRLVEFCRKAKADLQQCRFRGGLFTSNCFGGGEFTVCGT
jgi:hypothetical protein